MFRLKTFLAIAMLMSSVGLIQAETRINAPAPKATSSEVPEVLDSQLKNAVVNSASEAGTMDAASKKIFDEEVVPQYALFVRDYKRVGQSVNVVVDLDGIKNVIRFSAPKSFSQPAPKILLYLAVDTRCDKCMDESATIHKIMEERVVRRGFAPVWVGNGELAGQSMSDLTTPHGAVGYMKVDLIPAPADDEDAAHADEKRFQSKAVLEVRGITQYQDQAEFYDTDRFETQTQKLLTHAFTELGAKADLASMSGEMTDDVLIEVSGISDFPQYTRLKTALQARLKGTALLDERKVSKGKAVFALKTKQTLDQIKVSLKGTSVGDTGESKQAVVVAAVGGKDQLIQMEIR